MPAWAVNKMILGVGQNKSKSLAKEEKKTGGKQRTDEKYKDGKIKRKIRECCREKPETERDSHTQNERERRGRRERRERERATEISYRWLSLSMRHIHSSDRKSRDLSVTCYRIDNIHKHKEQNSYGCEAAGTAVAFKQRFTGHGRDFKGVGLLKKDNDRQRNMYRESRSKTDEMNLA